MQCEIICDVLRTIVISVHLFCVARVTVEMNSLVPLYIAHQTKRNICRSVNMWKGVCIWSYVHSLKQRNTLKSQIFW